MGISDYRIWKRVKFYVWTIAGIVLLALSGYAAYSKSITTVDDKIDSFKLETAKTLVTKEDLKEIKTEISELRKVQTDTAKSLGRIEGILQQMK
jgi:hypothetical protein